MTSSQLIQYVLQELSSSKRIMSVLSSHLCGLVFPLLYMRQRSIYVRIATVYLNIDEVEQHISYILIFLRSDAVC